MAFSKWETELKTFSKLTWDNGTRFYVPGLGNPKLQFARGPILLLDAWNKKKVRIPY